jgi:hypothetical protein
VFKFKLGQVAIAGFPLIDELVKPKRDLPGSKFLLAQTGLRLLGGDRNPQSS